MAGAPMTRNATTISSEQHHARVMNTRSGLMISRAVRRCDRRPAVIAQPQPHSSLKGTAPSDRAKFLQKRISGIAVA